MNKIPGLPFIRFTEKNRPCSEMKIVYGVLFALCSNLAYSQLEPSIVTYISKNEIIDNSSSIELTCRVSNITSCSTFSWLKLGFKNAAIPTLISVRHLIIVNDSRISAKQGQLLDSSILYTLQINRIRVTDLGFYRCQVFNVRIELSADVELKLGGSPIIYDNSTNSMVVKEGSPVILECYAHGLPNPKIYWKRENNKISNGFKSIYRGNIWKIPVINKNDRGSYSCIAENGFGNVTRHRITIHVQFAPIITVPKYRKGQALQYDMDLECNVEAYPSPGIIWTYNGTQLFNNEHYIISQIDSTDEYTTSILSIRKIKKSLYGEYKCVALNQFGNAEVTIHLYETALPVTSSITRVNK